MKRLFSVLFVILLFLACSKEQQQNIDAQAQKEREEQMKIQTIDTDIVKTSDNIEILSSIEIPSAKLKEYLTILNKDYYYFIFNSSRQYSYGYKALVFKIKNPSEMDKKDE
jgi:hypothetical protein